MINDSSLQNMNRSTIHMLLMWGASSLFNKLEKFHGATVPVSSENIPSEQSLMVDVVQEFMTILPQNGENMDTSNSSVILKVNGGSYIMNISLLGEKEIQSTFEELPNVFWTKLLEGRHPRWKYLSGSSQRNRKRVQYYDESPKKPEVEGGEAVKKRKKLYHRTDSASTKTRLGKVVCGSKGDSGTPAKTVSQSLPTSIACVNDTLHHPFTSPLLDNDISVEPEVHLVEFEERRKLRDAQKSLHILIKPEISKLCEILQLSEDVKGMVGKLLKYIMDNHHVNRESVTILQAFQISLCWIAASLLKHKIDHKESLALAKHHLNFGCEEEAVDYVYSKLSSLQEMFLEVTGSPLNPVSATKDTSKDFLHAGGSQSTTSCQQKVKLEVEERLLSLECCDKQVLSQQGQASEFRKAEKSITIKQIKKKCRKRMLNLLRKQQEEMQEFIRNCEEEKARLEKEHQVELAVVRSVHSHNPSRIDRLKILDDTFAKKLEEHKCQMNIRLENLKAMYSAARNKENERKACCLEEVKSWAPEQEQTTEQVRTHDGSSNVASVSVHLSKEQSRNVHSKPGGGVGLSRISETISSETAPCSGLIKTVTLPMRSTSVISHLDTRSSERVLVTGFEQHNRAASSSDSPKNFVSACPLSSEEQIPDRLILSTDGEVPFEVPETAPDEVVGHGPSNRENDGVDAMAFDRPNSPGVNQHDGGGSSINGGILSPVLLPVTVTFVATSHCSGSRRSTAIESGTPR
ncbi:hypothetical protein L1049_014221 [Liquidambar formosana]|uniref:MOM1 alpha-helical domain-containing protein n=1 Tax=Liquidambar formosana TaxID=63359 RepID=A0AAP0RLW7_LIQFO